MQVHFVGFPDAQAGGGWGFGERKCRLQVDAGQEIGHAFGQFLGVVAAFQHAEHFTGEGLCEQFADAVIKIARGAQLQHGVELVGVEARRDRYNIGVELFGHHEHIFYGVPHDIITAAGWQWIVDGKKLAGAFADFVAVAVTRVGGVLVQRPVEHLIGVVEYIHGAVAEMPVEVENQHFFAFFGCFLGGDGHVIEQAEAMGFIAVGVVAGRADEGKVALLHCFECEAHGGGSGFIASVAGIGIAVEREAVGGVVLNHFDVGFGVHQREPVGAVGCIGQRLEVVEIVETAERLGVRAGVVFKD